MKLSPKKQVGGFSLVEVVLALGLTAFTIIALLGLTSSALDQSRRSKQDTQLVNIAQDITSIMLSLIHISEPTRH